MKKSFWGSNKHVFWQAMVIAFVIFWSGLMLGILFEGQRVNQLEEVYFNSETDIFDIQLKNELLAKFEFDCNVALIENIAFADKIYFEAKELEKFDSANRLTEEVINVHKRYDLLRTMLWDSVIDLQESCPGVTNSVVYIYEYDRPNPAVHAKQIAMSRVLSDLKGKYGGQVILIPIAGDTGIRSLDLLMLKYEVKDLPSIVINQDHVITDLVTLEDLEEYLILNNIENQ